MWRLHYLLTGLLGLLLVFVSSGAVTGSTPDFFTDIDNADNAGQMVADGDMDVGIRQGDPNEPVEFYINVPVDPATISAANVEISAVGVDADSTLECASPEIDEVRVNGNPVGVLEGPDLRSLTKLSVDPSFLVNGDNLVQVLVDSDPPQCHVVVIEWGRIYLCDPPWAVPFGDPDCDGVRDSEEAFVGTDPNDNCPETVTANDEIDDRWPADLNDDKTVDILDIVQLMPPVFHSAPPNPNYSTRKDFNGDFSIDILEVVRLTPPTFNQSCV